MIKIEKLVVTTDEGNQITYEGDGFVTEPRKRSLKGQPRLKTILAHLTLKENKK